MPPGPLWAYRDRMSMDRVSNVFWLGGLAYLGFYVFGLVMGAYSPGEVLYFTIPAAVFAVAFVVRLVRGGGVRAAVGYDRAVRASRHLRERRGF